MKPLLVLLSVFTISVMTNKMLNGNFELALSGRIAMAAMLLFTAIGHFVYTKGMTMMLPNSFPSRTALVYFTGIIEICAAVGLFVPKLRMLTAWLLIAFFILMLPANIYAAIKQVNFQKATLDGHGLNYLWFRIPLQLVFIAWTYIAAIKFG